MKLFTVFFVLAAIVAILATAAPILDMPEIPGLDLVGTSTPNDAALNEALYAELLEDIEHSAELLGAPAQSEIILAAKLSGAAYCVGHNIQALANWQSKACPKEAKMASTTAWQFDGIAIGAYVGYDSAAKRIRVVYRGSSNIENWIANLAFAKTTWGGSGSVHFGFKTAYAQSRPKVIAKIQELQAKYGSVGIQVTGHSLGGAVATLCAVDLKAGVFTTTKLANGIEHVSSTMFPEPLPLTSQELQLLGAEQLAGQTFALAGPLITFGQPRVGDSAAASYINSKLSGNYYRITHRHDPVPRVPTQAMGFAHAPQEGYYPNQTSDTSGFFWCSNSMTEDARCIISPLINTSFTDHMWYAGVHLKQDASSCSP